MCAEMDNKQKITLCRLCFNSCDGAFVNVNDFRRKILAILFPQSKVKVSSVLCENCARCLQTLFAFKSNCLYLEEYINSFMDSNDNVKVDLKEIYLNMNKCKDEVNTGEGYIVCRLCVKLSDSNCMLLNENEKDEKSIQVMVQMCVPELDLSITKDPVICNSCYACVCNYFRFHKSYSNLEQMLKKYGEFEGTCGKNQIKQPTNELEFSGSNIINYKCNFVDDNQHEKKEDSRVMFNYENRIAIELPELDIKNEEVDIEMDEETIGENVLGYKSGHINTNRSNDCRENENSEIAKKYENVEINETADVGLTSENASSCKTKYFSTPVNFYEDEKGGEIKLKNVGEKNTRTLSITLENTKVQSEGARRILKISHKIIRDERNPFELPDATFRKLFRLSKPTVLYLVNNLTPHMNNCQSKRFIPNHLKIFATLHFLGKGSYHLGAGHSYIRLCPLSVSRYVVLVVNLINEHLANSWIKFPRSISERNNIKQRFLEKYNFAGVIGAIDCTHIAIVSPPANDPANPARIYYNRMRYSSINTQVICDADLKILSIDAEYPGSTHDATIWNTSNIKTYLEANFVNGNEEDIYLLGDSGYPLQPWLLTPIADAGAGTPQAQYNRIHIATRNCIERFKNVFKNRFRCMLGDRVLHYRPKRASKIIYSCAALHNIATYFREDMLDEEVEDVDCVPVPPPNVNDIWLNEGQRVRNKVIQTYFMRTKP